MPWVPRCVRQFMPDDAVARVPEVFAIAAVTMVAFEDPHPAAEHGNAVILSLMKRRGFGVARPIDTVRRTPDIAVDFPCRFRWRIVSATAENSDAVFENGAAADHPDLVLEHNRVMQRTRSPRDIVVDERPLFAVGRIPNGVVANSWKVFLVARVPSTQQPHAIIENQRTGTV